MKDRLKDTPRPAGSRNIPASGFLAEPWNRLGWCTAIVAFAIDQAYKTYMLHVVGLGVNESISLGPFLNVTLHWNCGISYGLFCQEGAGRWIFVALAFGACVIFARWLYRARSPVLAIALGLVIGGALGNGLDRAIYGAVADFFDLHVGSFHWYVFNFADVWIFAGMAGLIYQAWWGERPDEPEA